MINRTWTVLHYPPYWVYDILRGLLVLSRVGLVGDERCEDAHQAVGRPYLELESLDPEAALAATLGVAPDATIPSRDERDRG